jgi:DNA-binding transcriptional ArsR family regulator
MFKDIFGNTPQTKILDFLLDHPDYDYNISDIALNSKVSRPTTYKVVNTLLEKKLIMKTRESGQSSLYKLNLENKLVRMILKFDYELASKIAEIEAKETVKKYKPVLMSSKARAVPA